MNLDSELAQQIVDRANTIIPNPINVMDHQGIIIASSNPERLYQRHEGAVLALMKLQSIEVSASTADQLNGSKPGINLPIIFQQKAIGVIGISGPPDEVRYYGKLVRMAAEMTVEHARMLQEVHWTERKKEDLVLQWLDEDCNIESVRRQAAKFRVDVDKPHFVALLEVSGDKATEDLKNALSGAPFRLLAAVYQPNCLAVIFGAGSTEPESSEEIREWEQLNRYVDEHFACDCTRALGHYCSDPARICESLASAEAVLRCGRRLYPDRDRYCYQELLLPVAFENRRADWQQAVVRRPLEKLKMVDAGLVPTLQTWFEQNCDNKKTADTLHIHRNTLRYRLGRVGDICQLDLNNFSQLSLLYLSMVLAG